MLKIRLRRMGSRHKPFYRVVVSDSRRTPTASAVEEIGYYNPRNEPSVISIDTDRVEYWTGRGAQLSDAVKKLMKVAAAQPAVEAPAEAPAEKAEAAPESAEAPVEAAPEPAEAPVEAAPEPAEAPVEAASEEPAEAAAEEPAEAAEEPKADEEASPA